MLRFNQYDQIVHAALAGHGIALGRLALIAPMLADRRLAAVGGQPASATEHAYWLVRNARRSTPDADVVTRWLTEQAAATRADWGLITLAAHEDKFIQNFIKTGRDFARMPSACSETPPQ